MTRAGRVMVVGAAWLAAACGPKLGPNAVTADDAIVYIHSNLGDAQVYVDGRFIAQLDALGGGVAVAPGKHRLELRRDDYFSSYLEVDLTRAEHKKVGMAMAAILP